MRLKPFLSMSQGTQHIAVGVGRTLAPITITAFVWASVATGLHPVLVRFVAALVVPAAMSLLDTTIRIWQTSNYRRKKQTNTDHIDSLSGEE
jgi:hypothetical protein